MKKLFLGMVLMVSSSSYVLAKSIDIEKDDQQSFKATCYIQVVVNVENTCGQYLYSSASPKYSVNCQVGQASGSTSTYYEVRTEGGWNPGSDPNPATGC